MIMKKSVSFVLLLAILFIVLATNPQTTSADILGSIFGCKNLGDSCNLIPGNWCCDSLLCDSGTGRCQILRFP